MAQEILEDTGKDVGEFMKDFTVEYIKALIGGKLEGAMDEACEAVIPAQLSEITGGDDEEEEEDGGDDVVEEKGDDEKEQEKPLAAGAAIVGYKLGTGPDRSPHRYYDCACYAIKPTDSVICKVVKRHGQLTRFVSTMKKSNNETPNTAWPKKKMMGKNAEYYRNRYRAMETYFKDLSAVPSVTTSDEFLTYFDLQYDEKKAARLEVFMTAIESLCDSYNISFSRAQKTAERLGFDLDECEMLKVVAVEKVGREASRKLRVEINKNVPDFMPGKVKNKFHSTTEGKLAGIIATAVEAGWQAAKEAFTKIADKLNEVLDKGMDPIKELFMKALEPIGSVVKEKFDSAESKMEVDDGLDREITIERFPPLKAALDSIEGNGKAFEACETLVSKINEMNECFKFSGFLMYNLGDPEIGKYIPFLNEIQDNHYRLAIALTDCAYLLSRAASRAFKPLCDYVDKVGENGVDQKEHENKVTVALQESGRSLAMDYYDLPYQTRRMTWYLPNTVTNRLLKLGQTTICGIGDLLGTTVKNWKPSTKDDARKTFANALKDPLNKFVNDRVNLFVTIVRRGTEAIVAAQFMSTVEKVIDEVAGALNDLCSALPDPLGENLKAGDIVAYLLNKLAENAVVIGVKMLAKNTEKIMYDNNAFADASDESLVRRLRWSPRIRPDDYDASDPAEDDDEDDEEDGDKAKDDDKDNAADDNANAPGLSKQLTQENTPDSDEEDGGNKGDDGDK